MTFGLTDSGFEIPNLLDILEEKEIAYKQKYGQDFQAIDTNIIWQNAVIEAERELNVWQILESVYYSQTLSGAEGIYLDNALGLQGVYRRQAIAGSGYAVIESNSIVPNTTIIPDTVTFAATNGVIYKVDVATQHKDRVVGMLVAFSDYSGSTISATFNMVNPTTGSTLSVNNPTLDTSNNVEVTTFFNSIVTLIINNSDNTSSDAFVTNPNTDTVTLHIGYDTDDNLIGVSDPTSMYFDLDVGTKAGSVFVVATETGVNPLGIGGITSVTPTSANYSDITNTEVFTSGSDIETDAEYRARYNRLLDSAQAGTRSAVLSTVSNVDGVELVKIYDNPTAINQDEALAFTFNTVVKGGTTSDIAQAIYDSKPINANTSGDIAYSIDTEDGGVEVINFTRPVDTIIDIRITYTTTNNISLSSNEMSAINSSLVSLIDSLDLGTTIFNAQLQGSVFSSLSSGRLTSLTVEVKKSTQTDLSYSSANYIMSYNESVDTTSSNIFYVKV